MPGQSKRLCALAAAVLTAAGLAACAKSSPSTTSSSKPVYGGTLRIVAASGPDEIDTVPAYYTADYMLERAYARQLLSYPAAVAPTTTSAGWKKTTTPVADMATEVPSTSNGGITNGGKTYTFHIRSGVDWDSTPVRQVTSDDFIREFKAFCNPAPGGFVGNIDYFDATIVGMSSYCNKEIAYFKNTKTHPATATNITNFQNSNTISGISAPNSLTLKVNLIHPASDFLNIMSMPFVSGRPVEYDKYVPNSLQLDTHTLSDGPYKISSYIPGKSITLVRNPAWKQSTDPIRHQYVSKIVVTLGVTSAETQLADMEAGTEDLPMDTAINPPSIPGLIASKAPNFKIWAYSDTIPYIAFNLRSPDASGAMSKLGVRQAIEYGINKVAVQKVFGGPEVSQILNTVIPPGNGGYTNFNDYPTKDNSGNEAMCKSDLAKAGYPHGVSLNMMYINDSVDTDAFTAIQSSLKGCGITLTGKPEPGSSIFVDLGNAPVNNKAGTWDLGEGYWIPDWFGNNARTIIAPFFQTDCLVNTINYGCYSSSQMDSLISKAEAATSVSGAASYWSQADQLAMKNALIVPIINQKFPLYSAKAVHSIAGDAAVFVPNIGDADVTNVWLSNG
jgi:peptide/nickel transport system substrate-binding protein